MRIQPSRAIAKGGFWHRRPRHTFGKFAGAQRGRRFRISRRSPAMQSRRARACRTGRRPTRSSPPVASRTDQRTQRTRGARPLGRRPRPDFYCTVYPIPRIARRRAGRHAVTAWMHAGRVAESTKEYVYTAILMCALSAASVHGARCSTWDMLRRDRCSIGHAGLHIWPAVCGDRWAYYP
eukprot:SAG31_NODE_9132_length_1328_cov_1.684296_2_plen_179_part_01